MTDEILMSVAAAVAAKAAEALMSAGQGALTRLVRLVRNRFAGNDADAGVLDAATADPTDQPRVRALGELLERHALADPEFAEHLRALWTDARTELSADHGAVVNQVSGHVTGPVVQARDIHGGVTFN